MTEPTQQPTYTREQWEALFEERRRVLLEQVEMLIAAAVEPLTSALAKIEEGAVYYGERISLQAAEGQFICAEDGGPKVEREPFNLTSRAVNAGAWESFEVVRGQ